MWTRNKQGRRASGQDCGEWVTAGLQALRHTLREPADMPAPGDLDGWRQDLASPLLQGRLTEALAVLQAYERQSGKDTGIGPLMVATIRHLEALWAEDARVIPDVTLAFATARHLIEVWTEGHTKPRPNEARPRRRGPKVLPLLVAVAPGDDHSFGAQILADDLTLRGWAVDRLIAPSPDTLLRQIASRPYGALLISFGQDASLDGAGDLIAEARALSQNRGLFVLIGGAGLAQPLAQYHFLGADLIAASAAQGADFLGTRLAVGLQDTRN